MDEFKEPLSRVEAILQNILGADNELSDPESRVEAILLSILNDTPYTDLPQSRVEEELLAIKNSGTYTRDILSKVEDILLYKLNNEKYPEESLERVEELLIEWTDAVIEKQASGSIISVDDAVAAPLVSAQVDINPVQDLHGYDNPWPAGGGKNLLPDLQGARTTDSIYIGQTDGTTFPVHLSANTAYTVSVTVNSEAIGAQAYIKQSGGSNIKFADLLNGQGTYTPSTDMDVQMWIYAVNLTSVSKFQLEKGSIATAFSPYSNICPISGWDECKVMRAGKNLCEGLFSDGKVPSISSGALVNANNACRSDYIRVNSGSVTFSCKNTSSRTIYCFLYGENKDFLLYQLSTSNSVTATHADAKYAMIRCDSGVTAPDESMLELGSTATSYSPYQGNLYTISLGQTVYGGRLDVVNGELVVDRANIFASPTWTPKNISALSTYTRWQFYSTDTGLTLPADGTNKGRFSHGIYKAAYSDQSNHAYVNNTSNPAAIFVVEGIEATEAGIQTYIAQQNANGTPLQVVYPLATPIEISLTPTQIEMLENDNVLYADTGDLAITYKAKKEE